MIIIFPTIGVSNFTASKVPTPRRPCEVTILMSRPSKPGAINKHLYRFPLQSKQSVPFWKLKVRSSLQAP